MESRLIGTVASIAAAALMSHPAAAQSKSRFIIDNSGGVAAYTENNPCRSVIDVALRAPNARHYAPGAADELHSLIGGVIFVLAGECEGRGVAITKFTFAGCVGDALYYAAAATRPPAASGWTRHKITEISSVR